MSRVILVERLRERKFDENEAGRYGDIVYLSEVSQQPPPSPLQVDAYMEWLADCLELIGFNYYKDQICLVGSSLKIVLLSNVVLMGGGAVSFLIYDSMSGGYVSIDVEGALDDSRISQDP